MTLRFPLIAAASLVAIALILAALACTRTVQVVVTPTPEQEDANRPAATQTANTLVPTATPPPTPTRRPTSTPRPTVTRQPTSTSLVRTTGTRTSSRRPTATPMVRALGTRTATRQPTATPRSRVSTTETERFMVDAGNTYHYTIQIADSGFLNYEFAAVNSGNRSQQLDINFAITEPRGTLFFANRVTSFAGSIPVQGSKEYVFLFDNAFSLFAGKEVTFKFNWSSRPSREVTPYFGEHANSARCQQLRENNQPSGDEFPVETLATLAVSAFTGDWFSAIVGGLQLFLSSSQTDASGVTGADKAGLAIATWGCGIR